MNNSDIPDYKGGSSSVFYGNALTKATSPRINESDEQGSKPVKKSNKSGHIIRIIGCAILVLSATLPSIFKSYNARMSSPEQTVKSMEESGIDTMSQTFNTLAQMALTANSEGLRKTLSLIFQKGSAALTAEDLDTITFLNFTTEDGSKVVEYQRHEEGSGVLLDKGKVYPGEVDFSITNFSVLPNLKTLYMDYGSIISLTGLDQLQELGTSLTPSQIASMIDPEQIDTLTLYDLSREDLDGICEFTNLTILRLKNASFDRNALKSITSLDTVKVIFCE